MSQNPFDHKKPNNDRVVVQITDEQWTQLIENVGRINTLVNSILNHLGATRPTGFAAPAMFPWQTYYSNAAMNYARHPGNPAAQQFAFAHPGAMGTTTECCIDLLNIPIGPEASIELVAFAHPTLKYLAEKYHAQYVGQIATTTFKDKIVATFLDGFLRQFRYKTGMNQPVIYAGCETKYFTLSPEEREALSNVTYKEIETETPQVTLY